MENNVGIVGSRNFTDYKLFCKTIDEWVKLNGKIKKITSGGCKGADLLAEKYAKEHKIPLVIHKKKHKSSDGKNNQKIIDDSVRLIAFPSKKGKGTQSTIELANKKSIDVFVKYID